MQARTDLLGVFSSWETALPFLHLDAVFITLAVLGAVCAPLLVWRSMQLRRMKRPHQRAELELFKTGRRDPLTGLANRASFSEMLSRRMNEGRKVALLLIDLDGFKDINAAYGHRLGDDVLTAIASRLRALMPEGDQTARLGADEFALLLDCPHGTGDVEPAALRITRALMEPLLAGTQMVDISVSCGIALTTLHATDTDGMLRAAHAALDQAKSAGGGAWRFFDLEREHASQMRTQMKSELVDALASGQIIPHYQPIVDLRTGAMIGLEVLARWQHPDRGMLSPDLFIPMAEEMHLAGKITETLMRRVVRDSRDWPAWMYFAFNVSPGQLRELIGMMRNPPNWPEGEIEPHRLEVEVTESALIEDIDVAREVIDLLQARGTSVVLDDFGIGYSNFFHLRELPFNRIKIDKSFVLDMHRDPRAHACVRAMLALGESLGIKMVAEGVENADTAKDLVQLGCFYGQGFLYSPPVPAAGVMPLLRAQKLALAAA